METFRFLQFSDLHFETREYGWQWECPREKMEALETETREVVEKIVNLAKERQVDAILVAGDLFDDRMISLDGIRFLQDCFQGVEGIPVFITPGNEDPYGVSSLYNSQFLKAIGMNPWPSNVHIFTETPCSGVTVPGNEDITITGIPHVGQGLRKERPLAVPIAKDETRLNILLFHGTWEKDGASDEMATLPFSTEEFFSHHFDYVAFGHIHAAEHIKDADGRIRGGASGCPYGRKIDEIGEKTITVGQVERGGILPENLEKIRVAPRTINEVKIQCDRLKQIGALRRRIEGTLHRKHVDAMDMVVIRMEGRGNHELLRKIYEDSVKGMYFLAKMDTSGVQANFDFKKYLQGIDTELTTEGLFVRKMKELLDGDGDPRQRRALEKALEWGLDALINKRVEFDHENQEV